MRSADDRGARDQRGRNSGFDHFNCPTILFEPLHYGKLYMHLMHASFGQDNADLIHMGHGYGTDNQQWERLQRAYLLAPQAALEAVSWGKFQILAEYHVQAGYSTPEEFVSAMCRSEQDQLAALVFFIASIGLSSAFVKKDFAIIASRYNGRFYYKTHYDQKLEGIYDRLVREDAAKKWLAPRANGPAR